MADSSRVIYAEFRQGGTLMGIGTLRSRYDVDYCDRDRRLLLHDSGSGGYRTYVDGSAASWWGADGVIVEANRQQDRLKKLPRGWSIAKLARLVLENEVDGVVDCIVCGDSFSDAAPCEHLWWCEIEGMWTGPGLWEEERCNHGGVDRADCQRD